MTLRCDNASGAFSRTNLLSSNDTLHVIGFYVRITLAIGDYLRLRLRLLTNKKGKTFPDATDSFLIGQKSQTQSPIANVIRALCITIIQLCFVDVRTYTKVAGIGRLPTFLLLYARIKYLYFKKIENRFLIKIIDLL